MRYGQLNKYFTGVSVKRLTAVDAERDRSNQHEVGTTQDMRHQFLGEEGTQYYQTVYIWLGQDQDGFTIEDTATHSNVRKNKDRSQEWRLYYPSNRVTEAMGVGDTLFLAMDKNKILYFIVAPAGSTSEHQLLWLFGLQPPGDSFEYRGVHGHRAPGGFGLRCTLHT